MYWTRHFRSTASSGRGKPLRKAARLQVLVTEAVQCRPRGGGRWAGIIVAMLWEYCDINDHKLEFHVMPRGLSPLGNLTGSTGFLSTDSGRCSDQHHLVRVVVT
jgi:hypothetical protein